MEPFTETQSFNQPWIKIALLIPMITVISGIVFGQLREGDKTGLLIAFSILGLVAAVNYVSKLYTQIDERGIRIRFYPFHKIPYSVSWDEIESATIRQFNPLGEYRGWGIRYNEKNGKAFIVRGTTGLQLVLKSGKRFLIGTQKKEALQAYLTELRNRNNINCIN